MSDIVRTLRSILNEAVSLSLAPGNVAIAVKPPRVVRSVQTALTPDETRRLLAAVEGRRYAGPVHHVVNRQAITKAVKDAAEKAGLDPSKISTHTGRRTVVTNAYAEGGASLEDVARHVGHSSTKTTAGYVKALGKRPQATASIVLGLLDPADDTRLRRP